MKKLMFIANAKAGRGRSSAAFFDAACAFSKAGYLVSVRKPERYGDISRFAAEAKDYDLVVCAGGDGTLSSTLTGLMKNEGVNVPVGYIPCGSTNDFAASLGIPLTVPAAVENILTGMPRYLDLGLWGGVEFIYVASFGAFTKASYSAPQDIKNALGGAAYVLEGAKDLDTLRPYRVSIDTEEEHIEGDFLFGAISNSTSLAGRMKLSEQIVKMDDGLFELVLVPQPKNMEDLYKLFQTLAKREFDPRYVLVRHVKQVRFRTEEDIPWSLDGEFAASREEVFIENRHHAYQLILPEKD